MTLRGHVRAGGVCAWTLVLIAGCASSAAEGPLSSAEKSVGVSSSGIEQAPSPQGSSVAVPSPNRQTTVSPSSTNSASVEAADRLSVEAQWTRLWAIYAGIARIPAGDRDALLSEVTVSPLTEKLLQAASLANSDGIDNYGTVQHRIFWPTPINGQDSAVVADCQDQSQSGTISTDSGEILTTGQTRINLRGEFIRGSDGTWRAQQIINLGNSDC